VLESGYYGDTLVGGDGNDDILINRGLHTVSGGLGADRFYVMEPAYFKQFSTVTDASSGDRVCFDIITTFQSTEIVLSKYTFLLSSALDVATEGNATNRLSWFRFQGSTYVVQDRSAANGFDYTLDRVIALTGSIDLSKADFFNGEIILA
jgi:S-layer protein